MRKKVWKHLQRYGDWPVGNFRHQHERGDKKEAQRLGIPSWLRRYRARYGPGATDE